MANVLSIDWDARQFHIVAVRSARKEVHVEKAVSWTLPEDLTAQSAERLGKALREFLRSSGIVASGTLFALPRDRVILKEVHFPPVGVLEEPALVHFQVTKELTEAIGSSVIDYTPVKSAPRGGDRHVLAVVAKRDLLGALQGLAKAAGLKLLGIAPRPLGIAHALERSQPGSAAPVRAVLSLGETWAELCVLRGHDVVMSRSLAAGATLARDVRSSLAVHAAQHAGETGELAPQKLHIFGNGEADLPADLPIPVEQVDPITPADDIAPIPGRQGALAAAVGLAQCWAVQGSLPINLAAPKKAQAAANPRRERWVLTGGVLAVVLLLVVSAMYFALSKKRAEQTALAAQKTEFEDALKRYAQDKVDIDALKEWERTTVPWLDELHDLSARFPYQVGFRVNHLSTEAASKKAKDAHVASMRLSGIFPSGGEALPYQLNDVMTRDPHLRATVDKTKGQEFSLKIDVAKQQRKDYSLVLVVPPAVKRAPEPDPDADANDDKEGGNR